MINCVNFKITYMNPHQAISTTRHRLEIQGYHLTDEEIRAYRLGLRFAYALCVVLAGTGIIAESIPLLSFTMAVAFAAAWLPRHPFDYLYNHVVRHVVGRPAIPPRTSQGRFACGVASVWLMVTIYLFSMHYTIAAWALGLTLVGVGTLVSTTDICIPSICYNFLFSRPRKK